MTQSAAVGLRLVWKMDVWTLPLVGKYRNRSRVEMSRHLRWSGYERQLLEKRREEEVGTRPRTRIGPLMDRSGTTRLARLF